MEWRRQLQRSERGEGWQRVNMASVGRQKRKGWRRARIDLWLIAGGGAGGPTLQ